MQTSVAIRSSQLHPLSFLRCHTPRAPQESGFVSSCLSFFCDLVFIISFSVGISFSVPLYRGAHGKFRFLHLYLVGVISLILVTSLLLIVLDLLNVLVGASNFLLDDGFDNAGVLNLRIPAVTKDGRLVSLDPKVGYTPVLASPFGFEDLLIMF